MFVIYQEIIPMKHDTEMKHVSTVISERLQYWNEKAFFFCQEKGLLALNNSAFPVSEIRHWPLTAARWQYKTRKARQTTSNVLNFKKADLE